MGIQNFIWFICFPICAQDVCDEGLTRVEARNGIRSFDGVRVRPGDWRGIEVEFDWQDAPRPFTCDDKGLCPCRSIMDRW
jgi:hypothetical protein